MLAKLEAEVGTIKEMIEWHETSRIMGIVWRKQAIPPGGLTISGNPVPCISKVDTHRFVLIYLCSIAGPYFVAIVSAARRTYYK